MYMVVGRAVAADIAGRRATSVLLVPGGPYKRRWRLGAQLRRGGGRRAARAVMGFPGLAVSPTCAMAFPKKSVIICYVISGVVFPMKISRLILSPPAHPRQEALAGEFLPGLGGDERPGVLGGTGHLEAGPEEGYPVEIEDEVGVLLVGALLAPRNGIMAPLRNWRRSISEVHGGVLPTKSSRFTLFSAACWAARMEVRAEGTMVAVVEVKVGRELERGCWGVEWELGVERG